MGACLDCFENKDQEPKRKRIQSIHVAASKGDLAAVTRLINERKIEELELVIEAIGHEKSKLSEELQAAKEKLHSCEVMVTRLHSAASAAASVAGEDTADIVNTMVHDHQLESLTKQV